MPRINNINNNVRILHYVYCQQTTEAESDESRQLTHIVYSTTAFSIAR